MVVGGWWLVIGRCQLAIAAFLPAINHQLSTSPAIQPSRPQVIRQLFSDLAHRDAPVREQARMGLMSLSRQELPILRQIVSESRPLNPGQAVGLREIVTQAFLSGLDYERGNAAFLGVLPLDVVVRIPTDDGEESDREAVAVSEPMLGFCGYRALLEGDIILSVKAGNATTKIRQARDLILVIGEQAPGRIVEVRVIRKGAFITVPIRLDARPQAEAGRAMDRDEAAQFQAERRKIADDYWREQFAPLLGRDPL